MAYCPPSKDDWYYTHPFRDRYAEAYQEGWVAARSALHDNPYKPSGYERDSTYDDELHYWWYKGHSDWE